MGGNSLTQGPGRTDREDRAQSTPILTSGPAGEHAAFLQRSELKLGCGRGLCSRCPLLTLTHCNLPPSLPPQFLLIFRKAAAGELQEDSGLHVLARLSEIDVSTEGVKGAKNFFEAKVRRSRGLHGPAVR